MSNEAKNQQKAMAVFRDVVAMLESVPYAYAIGGGLCTEYWTGGASKIGDIDVVVRGDEAPQILQHLSESGYRIMEMEHSWLHKAFRDGVTIDLMFELKNGAVFDDTFKEHCSRGELFGTRAQIMSPEDQIASLAGTVDRQTVGQQWYNIIDIMANNDLEWDYVVARSQHIPLRMLSVVYFALSEEVPVQKGVIDQLIQLCSNADD